MQDKLCRFIIFSLCVFGGISNIASANIEIYENLDTEKALLDDSSFIRVMLDENVVKALVEVKGAHRVSNAETGETISRYKTGRRFRAHSIRDGLRWGEEFFGVNDIVIKPVSGSYVFVNGIQYKGFVSLHKNEDGLISVVNHVHVEDFLESVIPVKYQTVSNKEALSAIVIAERTLLLKSLKNQSEQSLFDITANKSCYFGYYSSVKNEDKILVNVVRQNHGLVIASNYDYLTFPADEIQSIVALAEKLAYNNLDARAILQKAFPRVDIIVATMSEMPVV